MMLHKPALDQLQRTLTQLLRESEAKAAVLVDQDGRCLTKKGFTQHIDIDTLSALVAGSFASTRALAKLVGESEFTIMFHQGKKDSIHNEIVDDDVLMTVIFDDRTTVGMVRLYTKQAVKKIRAIFAEQAEDSSNGSEAEEDSIGSGLGEAAAAAIDDLFGGEESS